MRCVVWCCVRIYKHTGKKQKSTAQADRPELEESGQRGSRDNIIVQIRHRSDDRKTFPGEFIRIRLKIEQNCRLFLDIFSSALMNYLFMTFTSRLTVDAKCVYQQ